MVRHFHALGQGPEVVAAVTAAGNVHALSRRLGELADHLRRDRLLTRAFQRGPRPFGVDLGLVAYGLQTGDALLQRWVVQIGDTRLNGVVEPLQPQLRLDRPLVQFGNVLAATVGAFLTAVENGAKDFLQPFGLKQAGFQVLGNEGCPASPWGSNGPCSRFRPAGPWSNKCNSDSARPCRSGASWLRRTRRRSKSR